MVWCVLGFCGFTEFCSFLWVGVIQVSGFAAGLGCMGCLEFVALGRVYATFVVYDALWVL